MTSRMLLAVAFVMIAASLTGCTSGPAEAPSTQRTDADSPDQTQRPSDSRSSSPSPSPTSTPAPIEVDTYWPRVAAVDCAHVLTAGELTADLGAVFETRVDSFRQTWEPLAIEARGGIECTWDPAVWPPTSRFTMVKVAVFRDGGVPPATSVAVGVSCPNNWCEFSLATNGYWAAGILLFDSIDTPSASDAAAMQAIMDDVRANLEADDPAPPFTPLAGAWPTWSYQQCEQIVAASGVVSDLGGPGLAPSGSGGGGEARAPGAIESVELLSMCSYYDPEPTGDDLRGLSVSAIGGGALVLDHVVALAGAVEQQVSGIDRVFVVPEREEFSVIYAFDGANCLKILAAVDDVHRFIPHIEALIGAFDAAAG